MTTRCDQYYGEGVIATQLKDFDVESLKRDLKYAIEDRAQLDRYIKTTRDQIERAKVTTFKTYVEFRKEHNHATGHINYRIRVFSLPDIPDAIQTAREMSIRVPEIDGYHKEKGSWNNPFLGNEKKAAIEFAQKIVEKFPGCTVIGNAAELLKKKDVIEV
jgi:arginine utilization protein RocB